MSTTWTAGVVKMGNDSPTRQAEPLHWLVTETRDGDQLLDRCVSADRFVTAADARATRIRRWKENRVPFAEHADGSIEVASYTPAGLPGPELANYRTRLWWLDSDPVYLHHVSPVSGGFPVGFPVMRGSAGTTGACGEGFGQQLPQHVGPVPLLGFGECVDLLECFRREADRDVTSPRGLRVRHVFDSSTWRTLAHMWYSGPHEHDHRPERQPPRRHRLGQDRQERHSRRRELHQRVHQRVHRAGDPQGLAHDRLRLGHLRRRQRDHGPGVFADLGEVGRGRMTYRDHDGARQL